jgi:sialic acid synthase SpsE
MNLNTLKKLDKIIKGNVGYSSHENEGYGIPYAIVAGAKYIERHFTLDKEWKGSDHGTVSSDPKEIEKIIADIKWIERILGDEDRKCYLKERQVRKIYRGF